MILHLTKEEERLYSIVMSIQGSMEEKSNELADLGVYDDYAQVHSHYASLANQGDIECLKRGLFLQWYSMSEPACFTGLGRVDGKSEQSILKLLDRLASAGEFDTELRWMLLHYHSVTDWYFESIKGASPGSLSSLIKWFRKNRKENSFPDEEVLDPSLDGRGQMSKYWYRPDHTIIDP